jgi:hypothetical protein
MQSMFEKRQYLILVHHLGKSSAAYNVVTMCTRPLWWEDQTPTNAVQAADFQWCVLTSIMTVVECAAQQILTKSMVWGLTSLNEANLQPSNSYGQRGLGHNILE